MSERIGPHTVYRWIGGSGQYLNAVPSRDLVGADLVALEDREGITAADIERSGLYEPVDWVEVAPFCGAETVDGGRCRREVGEWGERCWQHETTTNGEGNEWAPGDAAIKQPGVPF